MLLSDSLLDSADARAALDAVLQRVAVIGRQSERIPLYAPGAAGDWVFSRSGAWVGGFWAGLWWLRARLLGSPADLARAQALTRQLHDRLDDDTVNRSLIFWHGAQPALTQADSACHTLLIQAAERLVGSHQPDSEAFPLGTAMGAGADGAQRLNVDSLASLIALLHWHGPASARLARGHADTLLAACMQSDGHLHAHARRHGAGWQAEPASAPWPRGQAWAVLGLTQAAQCWGEPYVRHAQHAARFYLQHWPYDEPARPLAGTDLSAAVMMALALYRLAPLTDDAGAWRGHASRLLSQVVHSEYFLFSPHAGVQQGRFHGACYATRPGLTEQVEAPWASYFLAAALCHAAGLAVRPE